MWSYSKGFLLVAALQAYKSFTWTTVKVPHAGGDVDDTPGLLTAIASVSSNTTILFEKGVTYNLFTPVTLPSFSNVEVSIQGNITYPDNITAVQSAVTSSSYNGAWIAFSGGSNVTLRGSKDPNWGWIDGHGQAWWDENNQTNRPHGIAFSKISGGVITDVKIWKPVAWNFATSGSSNLHVFKNTILAITTNWTSAFPFNTDGFSAGGTNLLFEDNYIVNGDDCLTVGSGAINITFRNTYCERGHGLSIGSLGSGGSAANVQNVLIKNNYMKNSLYGARFKSWTGGNGVAKNITWKDIIFENVRFPIYVTQNYWDQGVGPRPNSTTTNETHLEDFVFENFKGTIDDSPDYFEGSCVSNPCWYAVANATGREVIIFDLYPNTTMDVLVKDISARTNSGAPVAVMCNASTIADDVGFVCQNGAFIPTSAGKY